MKPEKFLNALNDIDGQFIHEAREETAAAPPKAFRRFAVLAAAVIAMMALAVTAFASEEIAGWFQQYFARTSEAGLTSSQLEFIEKNEQIIEESQTHVGYSLELKSILSDGNAVYLTIGITAPDDVTEADLRSLWGSDIDFYDGSGNSCSSWSMDVLDDRDGLENTAILMFELTPVDWNSSNIWTLRIDTLSKYVYNKEYEQELLDTKYAGQEDIMFTDEEAALIHQQVVLAEGPWGFTFDLSEIEKSSVELVSAPVTAATCYGFTEEGVDLFDDVEITSFILSPLSATIQADCDYAPDFTAGGRKVYAVLTDGSRIELISNWSRVELAPNGGHVGKSHFNAAAPIILEEVDHILLSDGTKLMAP